MNPFRLPRVFLKAAVLVLACGQSLLATEAKVVPGAKSAEGDLAWETGVPVTTHWIPWSTLRSLETRSLEVDDEFVKGRQQITVVLLEKLLDAVGGWGDDDLLVAYCKDGYASYLPRSFVETQHPFLILEINKKGPETWPPAGLDFNPGPYVVSVSDELAPGVSTLLDIGHKKPWGVTRLLKVKSAEFLAPFYSGPWSNATPEVNAGRDLWLNSCFSCHTGPREGLGGNKSGRPFAALQSLATFGRDYVKGYVRNPKGMNPEAKMEPHPHYSDDELNKILAFLSAGVAK